MLDENPFAVCARGGRYFNNEMANNIWDNLTEDVLKEAIAEVTTGSAFEWRPGYGYWAVYRPNTPLVDILYILDDIWKLREAKDYDTADELKLLLGGKLMIKVDRIEWFTHIGLTN